jgi:murein DD-endopeptidase MepM/ murein hydrolase activator NlpD
MKKENKSNSKFPFWLKAEKNKIKLQLKSLGDKFLQKKSRKRGFTIIFLFILFIALGVAIYYFDYNSGDLSENKVIIESIKSGEDEKIRDIEPAQEVKLDVKKLSLSEEKGKETEDIIEENDNEGVVTESLRPMTKNINNNLLLLRPVSGEIIQEPGWYFHPIFSDWRYMQGIIIRANAGDIVMAAEKGKVVSVEDEEYRGITVLIEHENKWKTKYGHLMSSSVIVGEYIAKGQEIGRAGKTGIRTEPALYFELDNDEGPMDPREYFE